MLVVVVAGQQASWGRRLYTQLPGDADLCTPELDETEVGTPK